MMPMHRTLLACLTGLIAGTAPAYADVDIFLCSPSIPGESTDADFRDCTVLAAAGERIERLASGADKTIKSVDILPVEILKKFDLGSPALRRLALTEETFSGVVSFRSPGESPFVFLEIELQNAQVVNIEMNEDGNVPVERVTILPQRIGWTYTERKGDGSPGAKTEFFYDVKDGAAF